MSEREYTIPGGDLDNVTHETGGETWVLDLFQRSDGDYFWYVELLRVGYFDSHVSATREDAMLALLTAMRALAAEFGGRADTTGGAATSDTSA